MGTVSNGSSSADNERLVSVVVPCYRNQAEIPALFRALQRLNVELTPENVLDVVFVDDGSDDRTRDLLLELKSSAVFKTRVVCLSGNFGSYAAFHAGMSFASGEAVVQLHADLQDPPHYIPEMVEKWRKGAKLVIGQRVKRDDGMVNDFFSSCYHAVVKSFALPHVPPGGYDLILMDREIVQEVLPLSPRDINLVYLISSMKHPYETVSVERTKRVSGKSQWSLAGKVKLVIDTMAALSYSPVVWFRRISLVVGLCIMVTVIALGMMQSWSVIQKLVCVIAGVWSAMVLIGTAMLLEYVYRILNAVNGRPAYVVDRVIE
jgi:glycosyltransferase involved in cell wall biosynthesis